MFDFIVKNHFIKNVEDLGKKKKKRNKLDDFLCYFCLTFFPEFSICPLEIQVWPDII